MSRGGFETGIELASKLPIPHSSAHLVEKWKKSLIWTSVPIWGL
eukprot:gene7316-biopygen14110